AVAERPATVDDTVRRSAPAGTEMRSVRPSGHGVTVAASTPLGADTITGASKWPGSQRFSSAPAAISQMGPRTTAAQPPSSTWSGSGADDADDADETDGGGGRLGRFTIR